MNQRKLFIPLLFASLIGCGAPPQIGESEASFKAVDALYTAISLRDLKLVDQCQATIQDLQSKAKMSASAGQWLQAVIAQAHEGKWEAAQGRLGDFMRGQRR